MTFGKVGKFNLPRSAEIKTAKINGINAQKSAKNAKKASRMGNFNLPYKNIPFVKMKNDDFF